MTTSFVPRFTAFLMNVAATGWLIVGLAPTTMMRSDRAHSAKGAVTAPDPIVSRRAATDEAWQRRVQGSTLLPPNPGRTSFWKRYASSFDPFADPNPARERAPQRSRTFRNPAAAASSASSQVASRKWEAGSDGSTRSSALLGTPALRIKGVVSRWGWWT